MMTIIIFIVAAYIIGSVNFAIIIFKILGIGDPRNKFSGNAGTTNVYRQAGKFWAVIVLLLDAGRAVGLAFLTLNFIGPDPAPLVGFALITGNRYPCFHNFRGGKGVANYLGFTAVLTPLWAVIAAAAWLLVYLIIRVPFIASFFMIAALAAGTLIVNEYNIVASVFAVLTGMFVVFNHKKNIIEYVKKISENKLKKNNKIIILIFTLTIVSCFIMVIHGQETWEKVNPDETNEAGIAGNTDLIREPIFNSNIYFHETGKNNKDSIVLVHGIGDDASEIWSRLIPELEKQYHVIYFDLPGFGKSDKGNLLYSPENYSRLIKWIYDNYVKSPMCMIGHSLGGALSLYFSGEYPETVQRLILIDAAGILHGAALSGNLAKAKLEELSRLGSKASSLADYIESTIQSVSQSLPKDISSVLEQPFLRHLFFNNPKKIASAALINTDFSKQIESVKAPLFIIWGEKDMIAPLRTARMLSYNVPGSHLYVMPGLGHNPITENSSDFNRLVSECILHNEKFCGKPASPGQANKKRIILNGKEDVILEGSIESAEISNCRNILIRNVSSGSLKIINSTVIIENSVIKSEKTGLYASASDIAITGGSFTCGVGLLLSGSNVDLAGVKITAKYAAVSCSGDIPSNLTFSVCKIKSRFNNRRFHEVAGIKKDYPL